MYKKYFLSFLLIFFINVVQATTPTTVSVFEDIRLAHQGQAEAQYRLGFRYSIGKGVSKDHQEAFHWYERAAKQGHKDAQYNVAWMYLIGIGVEQDEKQAADLFKILAEQGDVDALYQLGEAYSMWTHDLSDEEEKRIFDMEEDYYSVAEIYSVLEDEKIQSQAFVWYEKAAEQGHLEAQYTVVLKLRYSDEFSGDGELVAFWYRKAAEQGHIDSQCELAKMYFEGKEIPQNLKEALYWGETVAKQGDGICGRYFLINMYQTEPVRDIALAYTWIIVVSFFDSPTSFEDRKAELATLLSPKQILEAEQRAQNLIYEINQNQQAHKEAMDILFSDEIVEIPRLSVEIFDEIYKYKERMKGVYGTVDAH